MNSFRLSTVASILLISWVGLANSEQSSLTQSSEVPIHVDLTQRTVGKPASFDLDLTCDGERSVKRFQAWPQGSALPAFESWGSFGTAIKISLLEGTPCEGSDPSKLRYVLLDKLVSLGEDVQDIHKAIELHRTIEENNTLLAHPIIPFVPDCIQNIQKAHKSGDVATDRMNGWIKRLERYDSKDVVPLFERAWIQPRRRYADLFNEMSRQVAVCAGKSFGAMDGYEFVTAEAELNIIISKQLNVFSNLGSRSSKSGDWETLDLGWGATAHVESENGFSLTYTCEIHGAKISAWITMTSLNVRRLFLSFGHTYERPLEVNLVGTFRFFHPDSTKKYARIAPVDRQIDLEKMFAYANVIEVRTEPWKEPALVFSARGSSDALRKADDLCKTIFKED